MGGVSRLGRLVRRHRVEGAFLADDSRAIVHCAHHKVGTVWFMRVLEGLAGAYDLRFLEHDLGKSASGADVVVYNHSRYFEPADFAARPLRGTHMIRDPRDVVVSGYHYHLWAEETWAREPREAWNGRSYQEQLKSLDFEQGLLLEIEVAAALQLPEMLDWDYADENFLELRYEDMVADEVGQFERAFEHYGLTAAATERGLEAVAAASFKQQTGRKVGERGERSHLRSGQPGEWREYFGPRHVERFKEVAPGAVVQLGYEPDDSWHA